MWERHKGLDICPYVVEYDMRGDPLESLVQKRSLNPHTVGRISVHLTLVSQPCPDSLRHVSLHRFHKVSIHQILLYNDTKFQKREKRIEKFKKKTTFVEV